MRSLRTVLARARRSTTAGLLIGLLVLSAHDVRAQTEVRFGSVGGLTDAGLYLAEELGYFKDAGLAVSMKRMPNAPGLLAALATDQLDVAGIAITPGLFSAISQGIGIRVVGDKQSYRPGFAATRMVVRPDLAGRTHEETIRALRGKKVAISSRAATGFANVGSILASADVKLTEVSITQLAYPSMVAALTSGAVDAAYIIEPFLSESLRRKVGVEVEISNVGHLGTAAASRAGAPLVYSEKFAQDRRVAQAFMEAYMRGVRVYNDAFAKGKDKDRVIEIMARHSGVSADTIRNSFPAGLDPDQGVNLATFQELQAFFIEHKLLAAPADLAKLIDTSFADAALKKLGKYD
jgi:NitT/TauT family transport system substrate-binding protein